MIPSDTFTNTYGMAEIYFSYPTSLFIFEKNMNARHFYGNFNARNTWDLPTDEPK